MLKIYICITKQKTERFEHVNAYDEHQIFVSFTVDYNRTDEAIINDLLKNLYVKYAVYHTSYCNKGQVTDERTIYNDSSNTISEPGQFTFAVAFDLNESQIENLDQVAVVFNDYDNIARYAYYLEKQKE